MASSRHDTAAGEMGRAHHEARLLLARLQDYLGVEPLGHLLPGKVVEAAGALWRAILRELGFNPFGMGDDGDFLGGAGREARESNVLEDYGAKLKDGEDGAQISAYRKALSYLMRPLY